MYHDHEIGIIGGGPAGASAASYLAKNGFDVCIFEKKIFPRETLCGEFLSEEVIKNIKDLDIYEEFLSLTPNKINSFRFFNHNGKSISSKLNFDAFAIKRSTFDNFLLNEASKAGAKIYQPAEIKDIQKDKNVFILNYKNGSCEKSVSVKRVIGAYGKQNNLDKKLNRNFVNFKSRLNGIKFHIDRNYFKDFNENEIRIFANKGIYCGVNSVNDNKVTICFLEDRNNYQNSVKNRLIEFIKCNNNFNKMFAFDLEESGSCRINDLPVYGTGNIFFGNRNLIENDIFMIGDSAGVIAPLAGDGIGMALETSKIVSKVFTEKRKHRNYNMKLNYIEEWNKMFTKRLRTAKLIQNIILTKYLKNIGFSFAYHYPIILDILIKKTRNS